MRKIPCLSNVVKVQQSENGGDSLHEYECGLNIYGVGEFNNKMIDLMRGVLLSHYTTNARIQATKKEGK